MAAVLFATVLALARRLLIPNPTPRSQLYYIAPKNIRWGLGVKFGKTCPNPTIWVHEVVLQEILMKHSKPMSPRAKKLAAMRAPKNKITRGDVIAAAQRKMKGRGKSSGSNYGK